MATYYIDPVGGNCRFDGLSPEKPLKSNKKLQLKPGDKVLFKRGSFIRGYINNVFGEEGNPIYYGAYGEGPLPVFCGSTEIASADLWEEVQKNIWVYSKTPKDEPCNIIFDGGKSYGTLRWSMEELTEQGDYFSNQFGVSVRGLGDGTKVKGQKLYLYSTKNPAEIYSSIECVFFGEKSAATNGHDMVFENLKIINFNYGIAGDKPSKNIAIRNCVFENIGGSVWGFEQKIRCGNVIEFWDVAENIEVTGCYIDNVYDSAVTHQGGKDCKPAKNMIFNNNVFLRCGMGALEQRDLVPIYAEFNENICAYAGEGFSKLGEEMPRFSEIWPEPMGHHAFMWRMKKATEGGCQQIKNNIFADAPYGAAIFSVCAPEADAQFEIEGNTYGGKFELLNQINGVKYKTFDEYKGVEKGAIFRDIDVKKEISDWKKRNNMEF